MTKRILLLILALLLLTGLSAAAENYEPPVDDALYRIVLRDAQGDTTLGTAVLYGDRQTLLTALACCAEGELYALGNDGEHAITSWEAVSGTNLAWMHLSAPAEAAPLTLSDGETSAMSYLFGTGSDGRMGAMPIYFIRLGRMDNQEQWVISGEEGLMPGSMLLDEKGRLLGLITAQRAEGLGAYAGPSIRALNRLLAASDEASPFLDAQLAWEEGHLLISWEDEAHRNGSYVISLSADDNSYYTDFDQPVSEKSADLILPPGHTYFVQVQWVRRVRDAVPPDWDTTLPLTIPRTAYAANGFSQTCYLASAPRGMEILGVLPETAEVTRAAMADKKTAFYLQVKSSYAAGTSGEVPMALELIAPDGQVYFEELVFRFLPDSAGDDHFALSLDDLLASCAEFSGGQLLTGVYQIRYSLSGQVAGECTFTLTDDGTAAEPAPTSGYAAGLKASRENGAITLTWDSAAIPEGAQVWCFVAYDGCPLLSFSKMAPGIAEWKGYDIPGQGALLWVYWSMTDEASYAVPQGSGSSLWLDALPEEALTAYGFRNVRIGLMPSADPAAEEKGVFLPQQPLTREMLSDRSTPLYFQTEDTYQISEASGDHPMVIVLQTPEGLRMNALFGYSFDPSLQASDMWLMDISSLFEAYETVTGSAAWPAGTYRILYCIDGQIAGEFTFTLD